jgi:tRNA(fMet)-specific endonuclease VapC
MRYLLDTDHISFLQRKSGLEFNDLSSRISRHSPDDFAVSIISFHEQVMGVHTYINRAKSNKDIVRGYTLLLEILQSFSTAKVLPFDESAAIIFHQLRQQKIRIATTDLRIASIALSQNLIVLSRNTRDFSQIPNLIIEDWTL